MIQFTQFFIMGKIKCPKVFTSTKREKAFGKHTMSTEKVCWQKSRIKTTNYTESGRFFMLREKYQKKSNIKTVLKTASPINMRKMAKKSKKHNIKTGVWTEKSSFAIPKEKLPISLNMLTEA